MRLRLPRCDQGNRTYQQPEDNQAKHGCTSFGWLCNDRTQVPGSHLVEALGTQIGDKIVFPRYESWKKLLCGRDQKRIDRVASQNREDDSSNVDVPHTARRVILGRSR